MLNLETVSVQDNFFAIGGHSLLATQIVTRIQNTLQVELPVRAVFENPTIASLGAHIDLLRWAVDDKPEEYQEI